MPKTPQRSPRRDLASRPSSEQAFLTNSVSYRNMAEQIAVAIRQAIADGKLPPGQRLVEMKIAREMDTSRGPLREALFQLEREGLVVRKPNRGTFVVGLTEEMVRQIASLRGVLEGFAARLAVKRLTKEDFDRLEDIIRDMSTKAGAGDIPGVAEQDYKLHEYILRASGHPLLHEMWAGLNQKIRIYQSSLNRMHGDMNLIVKAHRLIVRTLRRRNPERVGQVMADHMVEVLEPFLTKLVRSRTSSRPKK